MFVKLVTSIGYQSDSPVINCSIYCVLLETQNSTSVLALVRI